MLTPVFSIAQDDNVILLTIRAPYANIKDTEIEYEKHSVFFYAKPYFLRLYLPREVADDNSGSAEYDSDKGQFLVKIPKKNKGEFFPNLDMLSELLKPSIQPSAEPLVTEMEESGDEKKGGLEKSQKDDLLEERFLKERISQFGYGFGWRRYGVVEKLASEIGYLTDLREPDKISVEDRALECFKFDREHFNSGHYLADLFDPTESLKECLNSEVLSLVQDLSDTDREHLKEMSRHVLPKLSNKEQYEIGFSLIDILFAYLYDMRTMNGEHTVESGWTIIKLSATLTYFVRWKSVREALVSAVRRSLCYPLYRHWDLSQLVVNDLKSLLLSGRTALLHCLTDIRTILMTSGEYRYLLNDLYINEYCIWIQSVHNQILQRLTDEIESVEVNKEDIGLNLEELELEAKLRFLKVDEEKEDVDSDDDS